MRHWCGAAMIVMAVLSFNAALFGQDGVQGTADDVLYRIDQTSDYSECDYDLTAIAVTLDAVDDMDVIDPPQTVTCTALAGR